MPDHGQLPLTLLFEEVENGWVMVRIAEFPEVVTGGPTRMEASILALDALKEYLAVCLENQQPPVTAGPAASALR